MMYKANDRQCMVYCRHHTEPLFESHSLSSQPRLVCTVRDVECPIGWFSPALLTVEINPIVAKLRTVVNCETTKYKYLEWPGAVQRNCMFVCT